MGMHDSEQAWMTSRGPDGSPAPPGGGCGQPHTQTFWNEPGHFHGGYASPGEGEARFPNSRFMRLDKLSLKGPQRTL